MHNLALALHNGYQVTEVMMRFWAFKVSIR
jgi:hypothetical protein